MIAQRRIEGFLIREQLKEELSQQDKQNPVLKIENATFRQFGIKKTGTKVEEKQFELKDINLNLKDKCLLVVVGSVGSG